jgi:hypothetical protein
VRNCRMLMVYLFDLPSVVTAVLVEYFFANIYRNGRRAKAT